jgi:hypothetical protein
MIRSITAGLKPAVIPFLSNLYLHQLKAVARMPVIDPDKINTPWQGRDIQLEI